MRFRTLDEPCSFCEVGAGDGCLNVFTGRPFGDVHFLNTDCVPGAPVQITPDDESLGRMVREAIQDQLAANATATHRRVECVELDGVLGPGLLSVKLTVSATRVGRDGT